MWKEPPVKIVSEQSQPQNGVFSCRHLRQSPVEGSYSEQYQVAQATHQKGTATTSDYKFDFICKLNIRLCLINGFCPPSLSLSLSLSLSRIPSLFFTSICCACIFNFEVKREIENPCLRILFSSLAFRKRPFTHTNTASFGRPKGSTFASIKSATATEGFCNSFHRKGKQTVG
jgi:hypothetical protein